MAETLGVSRSALQRWITQSKNQPLETSQSAKPTMTNQEKRPQDWIRHRTAVYTHAKLNKPARWSGEIRNWDEIKEVSLNPDHQKTKKEEEKKAA